MARLVVGLVARAAPLQAAPPLRFRAAAARGQPAAPGVLAAPGAARFLESWLEEEGEKLVAPGVEHALGGAGAAVATTKELLRERYRERDLGERLRQQQVDIGEKSKRTEAECVAALAPRPPPRTRVVA